MPTLPTLDAHAHIDPKRSDRELANAGAVLAMTLSLAEAKRVIERELPFIAFGVGCHPRQLAAQQSFDPLVFAELAARTAVIGEVGLDMAYHVPLELQLRNLRTALSFAIQTPRIVSLHSFRCAGLMLDELRQTPVIAPILHWWTGSAKETHQAVELGCYFSIHSAVARRSIFRTQVPRERLLVESDHGWADPPGAIPHRVAWVEYLLSASLQMEVGEVRKLIWRNFAELVRKTGVRSILPGHLVEVIEQNTVTTEDSGVGKFQYL